MSLGCSPIHNTASNQGLAPQLASHHYLASSIEGFVPLHECSATDPPYGTASAAYGAGTITSDLTEGTWPSTDPVSTLMGYDDGVTDINPSIYPPVPDPTLAPGTVTTIQAG